MDNNEDQVDGGEGIGWGWGRNMKNDPMIKYNLKVVTSECDMSCIHAYAPEQTLSTKSGGWGCRMPALAPSQPNLK